MVYLNNYQTTTGPTRVDPEFTVAYPQAKRLLFCRENITLDFFKYVASFLRKYYNTIPKLEQLNIRRQMKFQLDGAPTHFHLAVRNYLNKVYRGR